MPLRIDLAADNSRGPGYGILHIQGAVPAASIRQGAAPAAPIRAAIQRNQGTAPYLGQNGQWESQCSFHALPAPDAGTPGVLTFHIGPDLVDPLALLPQNTKIKMILDLPEGKKESVVTLKRLFPSQAADSGTSPASPAPPASPASPAPFSQDLPSSDPFPAPTSASLPSVAPPSKPLLFQTSPISEQHPASTVRHENDRVFLLAAPIVFGVLAVGIGLFLWGSDIFRSPFSSPSPNTAAQETDSSGIATREALAVYLAASPAANDAFSTALALAERGSLDLAMLAFQYAARNGNAVAALALARMYDPATWSRKTSPMPQADAETAAYWYEPAAAAGLVEAQRQLGAILLTLPPADLQRPKGLAWLKKAAAGGDAQAAELLRTAEQ